MSIFSDEVLKEIEDRKAIPRTHAMEDLLTTRITTGVYWVQVPEADLYVLCGCPADIVKHMIANLRDRTQCHFALRCVDSER